MHQSWGSGWGEQPREALQPAWALRHQGFRWDLIHECGCCREKGEGNRKEKSSLNFCGALLLRFAAFPASLLQ